MADGETRKWRRYSVEFGGASVVYTVAVFATVRLNDWLEPRGASAAALAMIPVAAALLMLWAFLRQFWRMDELQRRVASEAMVVAALTVGLASFALGWAVAVMKASLPGPTGLWVAMLLWIIPVAMICVWSVAMVFVKRRYR